VKKILKKAIAFVCLIAILVTSVLPAVPVFVFAADNPNSNPNTHSGNWAIEMDMTATDWKSISGSYNLTQNTDYVLKAWIKGTGTLCPVVNSSTWTNITPYKEFTGTNQWVQIEIPFNSGSNSQVYMQLRNKGETGILYIDDIYLGLADGSANLIPHDGDLETGTPAGWWSEDEAKIKVKEFTTPIPVDSNTHGGTWSMKVQMNGSWVGAKSNDFTTVQNTDYVVKLWIKGSGTVELYAANKDWVTAQQKQVAAAGTWTQATLAFNSGANERMCVIIKNTGATGEVAYIDDLYVGTPAVGGAPEGSNLIENGSFEQGNTGWIFQNNSGISIIQPNLIVENSTITPTSATFNKNASEQKDITVAMTLNGNSFAGIKNGNTTLISGTDYIVTGSTLVLKKEYLASLSVGNTTLIFDMDKGIDPSLGVNVVDLAVEKGIVDEFEDSSKLFDYTKEGSNPAFGIVNDGVGEGFEGDGSRLLPHRNQDVSLIYKTDYEIESFYVHTYNWINVTDMDPIISVSANGVDYVPVEFIKNQLAIVGSYKDWAKIAYYSFDMPITNARYLKLTIPKQLPSDNESSSNWNYQYAKLVINRSLQPVIADPAGGILTGPTNVTLSNPTDGAEIWYYTKADATERLYTGPINISTSTELYTYAKKTGYLDSIVSKYTFFSESDRLIDTYGQWKSADFPDKVTSDEQLQADVAADAEYYGSLTPPERDIYGGYLDSQAKYGLTATGYFHIEKIKLPDATKGGVLTDKFVMVDPIGNLYYSLGLDCMGSPGETFTMVQGREQIYEWIPENSGDYAAAFLGGNSAYYSPYIANLIKKYQAPYNHTEFYERMVERVKKFGFTSEGGFAETPSVEDNTTGFPIMRFEYLPDGYKIGSTSMFDPYKAGAVEAVDAWLAANKVPDRKNDPQIVGYMFGNELPYHEFNTRVAALKASESAVKGKLVDVLEEKYVTIEALNTAWETTFASFDELRESPFQLNTDIAVADMDEFFKLYIDDFYSMITAGFRKADPNHMIMGDRYLVNVANNPTLRRALSEVSGKYLDVVSYNYYTDSADLNRLQEMVDLANKPIIITEFHYGIDDQGLGQGMRGAADETEQGNKYRYYVEKVAASGLVVGTHWFEMMDQAATGRWFQGIENGEAFGVGFFNVADRPHKAFAEEVMKTNYQIYELITGQIAPIKDPGGSEPPANKTTDIKKTKGTIVIDGVKDEAYPTGTTLTVDESRRSLGAQNRGTQATFDLAWDDTNLYVYSHVKDSTPMINTRSGFDIWNGDGMEIFIAGAAVGQEGPMRSKDSQIIISGQTGEAHFYRNGTSLPVQPVVESKVTLDPDGQGYTIEAAIPLEGIFIEDPQAGRVIGFDIGIDDGEASGRAAQYLWSGVDGNASARHLWGTATLTEEFVDTTAPSVPTGLTSTITSGSIALNWTASTDDTATIGYKVFRNGVELATTSVNSYTDTTVVQNNSYEYTVKAFDAAGNVSVASTALVVKYVIDNPKEYISRGEFVACLVKTFNLKAKFDTNFVDVPKTHKYYNEIGIAKKLGIAVGDKNNKFYPDKKVTGQEILLFVLRTIKYYGTSSYKFNAADLLKFTKLNGNITKSSAENMLKGILK
jgi:hypothetical protein